MPYEIRGMVIARLITSWSAKFARIHSAIVLSGHYRDTAY